MEHADAQEPVSGSAPEQPEARKRWVEPELQRQETLPRVTHGFAGSFPP